MAAHITLSDHENTTRAAVVPLATNSALAVAIVDGAGNQVTSFGGSGGTSATDDAAFTAGSGSGTPMMAFATSDAVNAGDVGVVAMDTARNLKVSIEADNVGIGGGTQYTEDAAAAADPVGTAVILVRKDTPAATVSTDGDNIAQRGTDYGAAYVTLLDTSGAAVSVGGGTQYDEDTASAAAEKLTMAGVVRKDTAATQVGTDGDRTTLIVGANGHLHTIDANSAASLAAVDGIEGLLTTIDGDTGVMAGAIRNEDEASASGHAGMVILAVRQDTVAASSGTDGDYEPLKVTGGRLQAATTVSGTVTVDGSGVTQPISHAALTELAAAINSNQVDVNIAASAATLTVASHAVTNAGTFAVQESGAALTALQLIDDTVFAEDVAAQAADKGIAILAVRRDADTTLVGTDNDYANLQVDAGGKLKVEVFSGETLPVSLATVPSHAVTNAGTFAVQVDGAALTALQVIDNPVLVDDAAFTPATSSVMMAGFEADEASIDSVDEGDAGAARMTLDRKVIVTPQPHTTGGLTIFRSLDLDETEEEVKGTAGQVYGWFIANLATSTRFVKFYNATAANVTVGTTTPVLTFPIPGNATDDIAANALGEHGITFDTAITLAATTGIADNDTGAPGANEVVVNLFYK